jgi:integrase
MLTDLSIRKLPVPAKRREIPDGKISGLYLIVQPSGQKSWALRYRSHGVPCKLTIGPLSAVPLAAARQRALEALGALAGGIDPAAAKRASKVALRADAREDDDRVEKVVRDFAAKYLARKVGAGWARESERLLKAHVIPRFGARRLGDVKRADVLVMLDDIVESAPIGANRALAVFSRLCNWSVERGLIAVSPCAGVKMPSAENERDRVLEGDDLRFAWRALESMGWPHGPIGQLLLLTAARRGEIGGMHWQEIDVAARTWTIPKERSKNGVAHEIPLSDAALRIIEQLPRFGGPTTFVFGANGQTPPSGFSKAKAKIDAAILAEATASGAEAPKPWVLHDLRRSAASGMAGIGIAPHVVEAVLNHRSGTIKGVAKVYNRYSYAAEKRAALDAWARRLEAIVSGAEASNLVKFARPMA